MTSASLERDLRGLRDSFVARESRSGGRIPAVAISPAAEFDLLASRVLLPAANDDAHLAGWMDRMRGRSSLRAEIIPLEQACGWRMDPATGCLAHDSGKFFSITGLKVRHRFDNDEIEWDQPIVEQPEIGILGIVARRIDGVLHVCMQAKEEPGNIGSVQLSPTVQATYSNYTKVHGGGAPPFLGHFLDPPAERLLFSRLQTEDGSRFFYKENRNMVVLVDDFPIELPEGFIWLTLRQVALLMRRDNIVNACARSVLSGLIFAGMGDGASSLRLLEEIGGGHGPLLDADSVSRVGEWLGAAEGGAPGVVPALQWLDERKARNHIVARREGLKDLTEWHLDGKGFFSHREGRFFRIVGLRVSAEKREVRSWCQPIIENSASGIIGLLVRDTPRGRELLMQAKAEAGNRVTVQLAPTVQFTPGNYHGSRKLAKPFLFDEFSGGSDFPSLGESLQAEEGARFFRECHAHRILLLPEGRELKIPPQFHWLPVQQVRFLLQLGEQVNSCARSVISCLL